MTLIDTIEKEPESFREAFDKVLDCICTTETILQLNTTKKLMENFIKLHEPQTIYTVFLGFRIESLEKELMNGVSV